MTEQELIELCSLGESTTVQYKLEFTTQKQIAEELVAFANTRGGIIVFGAEDKTEKMVGLTYEQVQYTSRELGNTANEQVRPVIYIETETVKHEGMAYVVAYVKNGIYKPICCAANYVGFQPKLPMCVDFLHFQHNINLTAQSYT